MKKNTSLLYVTALVFVSILFINSKIVLAQETKVTTEVITPKVINEIKKFVNQEIVYLATKNQNERFNNLSQNKIDELDKTWRAENKSTEKYLISATLANPLSAYLTRIQAHSRGLYTEIFVMDKNGLNVGQSSISSDYWQGDEGKFQKTYGKGINSIFIDEAEYNDTIGAWVAQVNLAVSEGNKLIGAITVEVNLTEIKRRQDLGIL